MSDEIQSLIDQQRNHLAQAAGLQIRICMAKGDIEGARKAQADRYEYVSARRTARAAGLIGECYFADVADEIRAGVPVDEAVCMGADAG